jgi:diguanylate cyclase (GGDEF)-like protein/PAS domain S-box-containing protein
MQHREEKLKTNWRVILRLLKTIIKKLDTAHKKLNKQYVDLKVRKEELKESETRYRLATECANDAIWDWDITNNKIQFAGRWYEMLGYMKGNKTEINSWAEVLHPDEEKSVKEAIFKHLESKNECYIMEHRLRKKNGEYIWVLNRGKAIWNDDEPVRMAGAMTDITQKKTAENKIYKMAYYDHLTSLPNRRCLMKEIEKFIIESNEQDKMAFLYIDIDDFKKINDSLNHSTGDSILVKISERLKKNARLTGEDRVFLSHTSGDEFVFVLRQIKSKEEIIECCNNILKIFNKPYKLRGHTIHISCSIGISVYPDDGKSFDALFRNADMSMYRAKRSGRNNYCFYNRDMKKEAVQNLEMESEIRTALLNNEFEVYLQPQIDCKTDEVLKSEALIRWNHPVKGLVPPGDFIHIAEKTGQIIELGMWTLRKACEINKEIQTKHGINMIVSVNLSAWELQQSGLNLKIKEILDETGLFPEFLELEITESLAMQDPELAIKTLIKIRKMGIKVALDDFGTGYSSLNYLKILPITNLKIDKELIDDIVNNITEKNIVDFIIKLAHELNLEVTVEGVEDSKQYALIKGMECDRIQGYYISKPLTEKAFLNYIKNNQNKKGA